MTVEGFVAIGRIAGVECACRLRGFSFSVSICALGGECAIMVTTDPRSGLLAA